MDLKLNISDKMPSFSALNQDGDLIESSNLIGLPLVIFFYPKNNTPTCTLEACSFRDALQVWDDVDAFVIGISPDSVESHRNFSLEHGLNFTLLSDEDLAICKKFHVLLPGTPEKPFPIERTTFVIDSQSNIRWIERAVSVPGHVKRVKHALEKI